MQFRLADLDLRWTGTDDNTPARHVIAVGLDPLGNTRTFLWAGDKPSDDTYRGSVLHGDRNQVAYGPRGGYAGNGAPLSVLLADLANA